MGLRVLYILGRDVLQYIRWNWVYKYLQKAEVMEGVGR